MLNLQFIPTERSAWNGVKLLNASLPLADPSFVMYVRQDLGEGRSTTTSSDFEPESEDRMMASRLERLYPPVSPKL